MRPILLAIVALGTLAPASGHGEDRVLSGDEVGTLLAGKLVEGRNVKRGFSFRRFYRADGVFFAVRSRDGEERRLEGRWRMTTGDRICLRWLPPPDDAGDVSADELCRNVVLDRSGAYRKVLIKPDGKRITVVEYHRFIPGNRDDLDSAPG